MGLNEQINLTRHTTYDLFARRDLLDTYNLAAFIPPNQEVLDWAQAAVCGNPARHPAPRLEGQPLRQRGQESPSRRPTGSAIEAADYRARRSSPGCVGGTYLRHRRNSRGRFDHSAMQLAEGLLALLQLSAGHQGPRWVDERGEARHRGVIMAFVCDASMVTRCLERNPSR